MPLCSADRSPPGEDRPVTRDTDDRRVGHRRQLARRPGRGAPGRPGDHRPAARGHRPPTGRPRGPRPDRGPARRRAGGRRGRRRLRGRRDPARRRRAARATSRSATTGCSTPDGPRPPADRLPRPLLAARGPRAGAGRCSCTRPASRDSWGIGDLADLRAVRAHGRRPGRRLRARSTRCTPSPRPPEQEASPYLPATRRFRNPIYLRVAEVPGADGVDLEDDAGRALSDGALIDRDAIWARKREVLHADLRRRTAATRPFARLAVRTRASRCRTGRPGARSPTSTAPDWHTWPEELRDPRGAAVAALRRAGTSAAVAFHAWLQWVLDLQLHRRHRGHDRHPGPADRRRRRRRRRLGLAGRARRRASSVGAPAGRLQQPRARTGAPRRWCPWRLRRRRLRAVHPVDPGHHRRRRRPARSTT